jgi:Cu(I)/Ag(I) efflux system membrane protein CusA/SilA
MRHGENALSVIERVKKKITEITPSLPKGLEIVTTYDRSTLILNAIHTLKEKLLEEMIVVSIVILISYGIFRLQLFQFLRFQFRLS